MPGINRVINSSRLWFHHSLVFMIKLIALITLLFSTSVLPTNNILLIESYHADYRWDMDYKEGLASVLQDKYVINSFQMDTKRLPSELYSKKAQQAWQMYLDRKPDLVILADDNALKYLGPKLAETSTPVVYLGINQNPRIYQIHHSDNITGVLERPLFKRSIVTVKKLLPNAKRMLVLFDSGSTAQTIFTETFKDKNKFTLVDVDVDVKLVASWEQWQSLVLSSRHYDAVFFGLYHTLTDAQGQHIPAETVISWSSEHTPVPPFGFWSFTVGANRTLGGLVLSGKVQGAEAGKLIKIILERGILPGRILPVIPTKGVYLFSRSKLAQYQLELPEKLKKAANLTD